MNDIKAEIVRVTDAMNKTKSPKLKRDYEKHLTKLKARLRKSRLESAND